MIPVNVNFFSTLRMNTKMWDRLLVRHFANNNRLKQNKNHFDNFCFPSGHFYYVQVFYALSLRPHLFWYIYNIINWKRGQSCSAKWSKKEKKKHDIFHFRLQLKNYDLKSKIIRLFIQFAIAKNGYNFLFFWFCVLPSNIWMKRFDQIAK